MAVVKKGSMLEGLSGRVGDLVFRSRGERTIVSRRPRKRKRTTERSPERQRTISRFQEAVAFAREARHRHAYRSLSRVLRGYSPYHVALQDYLSDPAIEGVDASGVGPRGGELVIRVSEQVAVRAVRVRMIGESSGRDPIQLSPDTRVGPDARVGPAEGLETATSPESADPNTEKPRLPIPAALFFGPANASKDRVSEKPVPGTEEAAGPTAEDPEPETSGTPDFEAFSAWAKRRLGVQRKGDLAGTESNDEIWVVSLPRPGEVEIIASDYAGNRASRTMRVDPLGSAPLA